MINTIYYAHHLHKYNTQEELDEMEAIANHYNSNCVIINPNGWVAQIGEEFYIMEQCLQMVRKCDTLIFSSIEDEIIGKGVYSEIQTALENNKDIYYLNKELKLIKFKQSDFDNIEIIYEQTKTGRKYGIVNL